jgi:hypothetical protein
MAGYIELAGIVIQSDNGWNIGKKIRGRLFSVLFVVLWEYFIY